MSGSQRSDQPEGLGIVRETESRSVARSGVGDRPEMSDRSRSGQASVLVDAFTLEAGERYLGAGCRGPASFG